MMTSNPRAYYDQAGLWDEPGYDTGELVKAIECLMPNGVQTILDVGCGSGLVAERLARHHRVVGIDLSREALCRVKVPCVMSPVDALPFADQSMDLVLISNVLEHLPKAMLQRAVREVSRVAKNHILVVSPYREYLALGEVKCTGCGLVYHMNDHLRSVGLEDLDGWFSGTFTRCAITFWGSPWLRYEPRLWNLRQELGDGWSHYRHAMCPSCGRPPEPLSDEAVNPVQRTLDDVNAELVSFRDAEHAHTPLESEVAVLFSRITEAAVAHPLIPERAVTLSREDTEPLLCIPLPQGSHSYLQTVRLVAKHRWSLDLSDVRRCHGATGSQDPASYICANKHAGWGERTVTDGRTVRFLKFSANPLQHGVFVVPRAAGRGCGVTIVYKDLTSGPVHLKVYDRDCGYRYLGRFETLGDGQWKHATFVVPTSLAPTGHGFQFNVIGDNRAVGAAIAIERIIVNGQDDRVYDPPSFEIIREGRHDFLVGRIPPEFQRPNGYEWCLELELSDDEPFAEVCYGVAGKSVVAFMVDWNQLLTCSEVRIPEWWPWGCESERVVAISETLSDSFNQDNRLLRKAVGELQSALEEQNQLLRSRFVRWALAIDRLIGAARRRHRT